MTRMRSETATQLSVSGRPTWASPPRRVDPAVFNLGLLAALASCVAFWVLVALTMYWLI